MPTLSIVKASSAVTQHELADPDGANGSSRAHPILEENDKCNHILTRYKHLCQVFPCHCLYVIFDLCRPA